VACFELAGLLSQPNTEGCDQFAAYAWFCLAEAYGMSCEKQTQKLETQLTKEQVLGAQLRATQEFRPTVVFTVEEEVANGTFFNRLTSG
jgi:hypothetical protein